MSEVCTPWIEGADVAACCGAEVTTDAVFDDFAEAASDLLFELSGRRFPGICETTARPCRTMCGCPWQILSRGHIVWNPNYLDPFYGWWSCNGDACGCWPLSRVLLSGYVTEVSEVRINGDVVDPDTYRVDQHRWLVRTRPTADDQPNVWPGCQALDLPDTQDGTWAVDYSYGVDAPIAGQNAASQLACEMWKQCNGQECSLPPGVTRTVRAGVVVERPAFVAWGWNRGGRSIPKGWNTGLPMVDAFLNAYNPAGLTKAPVFWSPATEGKYAPTLGLA